MASKTYSISTSDQSKHKESLNTTDGPKGTEVPLGRATYVPF